MKGYIFDIKRFAIHDGPGIRVTFFMQGCPLDCWWCHNPEGIPSAGEKDRHAERIHSTRTITAEEVLAEAEKDLVFMEESGGGVTFSGGEPLSQSEFVREACGLLKERDYHVALDTSGFAARREFDRLEGLVDLYLYDLKFIDNALNLGYTGVEARPILENLDHLLGAELPVWLRIPVIPGINVEHNNMEKIRDWLKKRKPCSRLSLMPYHTGGSGKYARMNRENRAQDIEIPGDQLLNDLKSFFEEAGYRVTIGG